MSILTWLKRLTRRRLDDQDFDAEIRAHLAMATEDRAAALSLTRHASGETRAASTARTRATPRSGTSAT